MEQYLDCVSIVGKDILIGHSKSVILVMHYRASLRVLYLVVSQAYLIRLYEYEILILILGSSYKQLAERDLP